MSFSASSFYWLKTCSLEIIGDLFGSFLNFSLAIIDWFNLLTAIRNDDMHQERENAEFW
ncbi:hypothetical protein T4B_3081 [Trichinella pseudospiralis]|uniref:Uncharacterized protein n=1 Tax=Trichinella pseudospiralis TaxID=6337 RepID=A0A0V1GPH9_TRIPS|nr:hypothetical protein T4B_3081 [Trichinella pseudospiralis]